MDAVRMSAQERATMKANGIRRQVVHQRMLRGWTLERAITEPPRPPKVHWTAEQGFSRDQLLTMEVNGLTPEVVADRLAKGWKLFDALIKKEGAS